MDPIIDAARAHVTMGEMCDALREIWGIWRETPVFSLMRAFAERWLPWVALSFSCRHRGVRDHEAMHDSSPAALPHKAAPLNAAVDFDA